MAGASAIYILDSKGKPIISRDYRGDILNTNVSEKFISHVIDQEDIYVKPIFEENGVSFCWVRCNNLYILAVTKVNLNGMMILTFLYRLSTILTSYYKYLEEESIRDNFVLTYELLDELMDNGYPQTTEVKVLGEFIKNEAHQLSTSSVRPPTALTNAVSWRSENIFYKKNEIFLDVVEKLNLLVSANGNILRSEILGSLKMKSFLSGMPELKLGLNDKLLFENSKFKSNKLVEMEDIKFHQCVRLTRFQNDRTISFIPPDGEFELMSYRLNNVGGGGGTAGQNGLGGSGGGGLGGGAAGGKPLIWVETSIDLSSTNIEYVIKAKSQFKARSCANGVEIHIPVPLDSGSPIFKSSVGSAKYIPDRDEIVWIIKQFQGQRDLTLTASFSLPSVCDENLRTQFMKKPIYIHFEIPYFTVSGITVRYLKIIEKTGYHALPWVRYITQNGDYQLRIS